MFPSLLAMVTLEVLVESSVHHLVPHDLKEELSSTNLFLRRFAVTVFLPIHDT